MSLSTVLALMMGATSMVADLPNVTPTQKQIVQNQKNTKGSSTRLTPSGRYKKYATPTNKNSFKQTRRKELTKSRKKRNKQL
tara:strand:+ start:1307 stop:1552 length:246 start_codon:yes stop_codon:yes gene_type:complete